MCDRVVSEVLATSKRPKSPSWMPSVETAAEHLISTHVHDNHAREDEHLVPYLGSIDWNLALVTMQKIGYDGTYLMELAASGSPGAVLEEARRARQRFERTLRHA